MKMSPSISSLAAAMAKAQADMGAAHKGAKNPAFNSTYADLASVIDAVKPHLTANGLAYFQFVLTSPEGVGVETLLTHASGEFIAGDPFFVPVAKANAHGFGSALTYARRYSLAAVCGLKAEDDDGNAAAAAEPERKPNTAKQVAVDAFELLPVDVQSRLQNMASAIIDLHDNKEPMVEFVERAKLDTDEKLGLWSLLPSHVRSAYKREQKEGQPPPKPRHFTPTELGTQP